MEMCNVIWKMQDKYKTWVKAFMISPAIDGCKKLI